MKRKILLLTLIVLAVVFITAGITYAFYSYSKVGTTQNTISSGTITFHYTEGNRNIALDDALPMSDEEGKIQAKYFDFSIESTTSSTIELPYYVTVRRSSDSEVTLDSHVKLYLTKVDNNGVETPVSLAEGKNILKVSELGTYSNPKITIPASERSLYTDIVPINSSDYNQKYRLRMWLDSETDFSGVEVTKYYCDDSEVTQANYESCVGNKSTQTEMEYPFNGKIYALTVNVYSEGQVTSATPDTPSVEPCTNCVYTYTTDTWDIGGTNPTVLTSSQYKDNYQDVVNETGRDIFVGLTLDNSGIIQKAYACAIKDGEPFCMEGLGDNTVYNANKTLISNLYGPYDSNTNLGCVEQIDGLSCSNNYIEAVTSEDGYVSVRDEDGACEVTTGNYVTCFGW